jgi:hypothetical protein
MKYTEASAQAHGLVASPHEKTPTAYDGFPEKLKQKHKQ